MSFRNFLSTDYELGFKNLFFKCNSPQVFSEFQPVTFIRPGKLVMTCDPKSNKWYRSVVQAKVEGQDLFKVNYISCFDFFIFIIIIIFFFKRFDSRHCNC